MRRTIMAGILALGIGLGGTLAGCQEDTTPSVPVITVDRDETVPVDPPTQLNVRDVTKVECDDMGGRYVAATRVCEDVDY